MYISRLALDDFRSWQQCVIDFHEGIVILEGANGLGKTNIVEAIELVSTGSSHRSSSMQPLIRHGAQKATVRLNVTESFAETDGNTNENVDNGTDDGTEHGSHTTTYEVTIQSRGGVRARINGGKSAYLRQIAGKIPCVTFAPDDQRIVWADPQVRRALLDQLGSMLIPEYALQLQKVQQIGKQRATLLKNIQQAQSQEQVQASLSTLEVWTGQFSEEGIALTRMRKQLIERLQQPFTTIHTQLTQGTGQTQASLAYEPSFEEVLVEEDPRLSISQHFARLYAGEVSRGINLIGPQRDDISILLEGFSAREYASNGQMWTIALALKMAMAQLLEESYGQAPLIVLDDVFAQLDDTRRESIVEFARNKPQVFITAASMHDIPQSLKNEHSQHWQHINIAEVLQRQQLLTPTPITLEKLQGEV